MAREITINVTAACIDRAKKLVERNRVQLGRCCPVALAAIAVIPGVRWVGTFRIVLSRNRSIDLPHEAKQFIAAFDAKGVVQPFKFKVPVP